MRRFGAALLAALAVGACGGGDGDVSDGAQRALEPHVAEIRLAAAAGDAAQLRTDLTELRDTIGVLLTEGELSEEGAASIRRQADAVEQQISLITTTTTATTILIRPTPDRNDDGGNEEKKGEGGKQGGRGGDRDDD